MQLKKAPSRIEGNIINITGKNIFYGSLKISGGKIHSIEKISDSFQPSSNFILPGFIDAHVHIESSMLTPAEFARLAVVHGTVATVSDPHEIANVTGIKGVEFMIENARSVPFHFNLGAPSCVPATTFETAGGELSSNEVHELLSRKEILYLSEMMNFPGVLANDKEVMAKIRSAKFFNKRVDGHAPGLRGKEAKQYIDAGISTDHECFTKEEAMEKLQFGMKILIREGSAAKNFEALIDLLNDHEDDIMFCSDDKHPDSLVEGHINQLCARAVAKNINVFKVLKAACINPVKHYKLQSGTLQTGDNADFIVVEDLKTFKLLKTFINGYLVAENGKTCINQVPSPPPVNNFNCKEINETSLVIKTSGNNTIAVIEALDGQLITNKIFVQPVVINNEIQADVSRDILKLVVVNRYSNAPPAVAFIKNIGLKKGAIASSVAHDSHNIIATGVDDKSIAEAINLVIQHTGGISCIAPFGKEVLPLPVAGLMSLDDGYKVAEKYTTIDAMAKRCGSTLSAPFMTLSFMALLVIPHIKLSDKGLFDGDAFAFL